MLRRIFNAPRAVVWEAWTDPRRVAQWWGPRGFTITIEEMDVRTNGVWKSTMHGPDGTDYRNDCVFLEVVRPERIVYRLAGGRAEESDVQAVVSWSFEARGEKTMVTLRMAFPTAEAGKRGEAKYGVMEGGNETLDRLGEYLAGGVAG